MTTNLTPTVSQIENQTLALAGVFQSATLVHQLSTTGQLNQTAFDCSFDSLFTFDAPTTIDVFGDIANIQLGVNTLKTYLAGESGAATKSIVYYILTLLKIAKQLKRNDTMSSKIIERLQTIDTQSRQFELGRSNLTAKIGELYQETISTINPRIMVRGEQIYLSNNDSASKIRMLLLAGIRAAILWQQLGGSKWRLIFARTTYVQAAIKLQIEEQG